MMLPIMAKARMRPNREALVIWVLIRESSYEASEKRKGKERTKLEANYMSHLFISVSLPSCLLHLVSAFSSD